MNLQGLFSGSKRISISGQIALTTGILIALPLVGTAGFVIIEGWSVVDSAYMTVITLSTVGYGEVSPLSTAGRLFTIALIVSGVGAVAYAVSTMFEAALSEHAIEQRSLRRRMKLINRLENHVIICGYGQMGSHVAEGLEEEGIPFVIVDREQAAIEFAVKHGHLFLRGDAASEEVLNDVGISKARTLIVAVGSDAESVFIVLTARGLNPDLAIVARADDVNSEPKLLRAGASRVILPYALGGQRMVSLVSRPGVADFLDEVMRAGELEIRMDQITIPADSPYVGRTLAEARVGQDFGVTILAIATDESVLTNPQSDDRLDAHARVIALGTLDSLNDFRREIAP